MSNAKRERYHNSVFSAPEPQCAGAPEVFNGYLITSIGDYYKGYVGADSSAADAGSACNADGASLPIFSSQKEFFDISFFKGFPQKFPTN